MKSSPYCATSTCPDCSYPRTKRIKNQELYWFCRHCWNHKKVLPAEEIKAQGLQGIEEQSTDLSTQPLFWKCSMKILPDNVFFYRKTPTFTQETIPKGLLNRHTTKAGSWGKICVLSGQLSYQILTDPGEEHTITPDFPGIIEPEVPHQVKALQAVEFYVEFHRASDQK